jgi:hypothetical protein
MLLPKMAISYTLLQAATAFLFSFVAILLNSMQKQESFYCSALEEAILEVERLETELARKNEKKRRRTTKPFASLTRCAQWKRRKMAEPAIQEMRELFDGDMSQLSKALQKEELIKIVEIHSKTHIDDVTCKLIYEEIRESIPLEKLVHLKEVGSISDKTYGEFVKLSPELRKVLPKPYHTVTLQRNLDKNLAYFDPKPTKDGVDLDPQICFFKGLEQHSLLPEPDSEVECCISGDGRPVRARGHWSGQTAVGFKFGSSQSPDACEKQCKR